MQYGVYLPNFGPFGDARVLAEYARLAEEAGWDGFYIWDHIAPWPGWSDYLVDPWVALTAVAMSTRRIRIGMTVTPLPRRRPWKVARETVSLDRLSGGRLTLGVGIGGEGKEYDSLGEERDLKKRGAMLDEALAVVTGLWSGENFSYTGEYYQVQDQRFLPKPVQQPRIPVWVGGFWPHKAPLRRAAKWDGAYILYQEGPQEMDQIRETSAFLREQRGDSTAPFDMVYLGRPTPGSNKKEAAEIVREYADLGVTYWLENTLPFVFGGDLGENWPMESIRERIIQGPPRVE
jgi:probable F420-dependent oxidoreductase